VPASLVGDTINVLSDNWWQGYTSDLANYPNCRGDCQSRRPLVNRFASTGTEVRAAFIGGIDVTTVGAFSGGFENSLRHHETWGTTALFWRGSFATLGPPQRANGSWCGTGSACTGSMLPGLRPRRGRRNTLPTTTAAVPRHRCAAGAR